MVCPFLFVKLDISIDIIYRFAAAAWRPICGTGTSACGTVGTSLTLTALPLPHGVPSAGREPPLAVQSEPLLQLKPA